MSDRFANRWASRIMIAAFGGIVLLPLLGAGWLPYVSARWNRALAREASLDGDYSDAVEHFERVLSAEPTDKSLRLSKIDLLIKAERYEEARDEARALVDEYPDGLRTAKKADRQPSYFLHYDLLSLSYQSLGQFELALSTSDKKRAYLPELRSSQAINSRAYECALAGSELEPSLAAMDSMLADELDLGMTLFNSAMVHWTLLDKGNRYWQFAPEGRERTMRLALADFETSITAFESELETVKNELEKAKVEEGLKRIQSGLLQAVSGLSSAVRSSSAETGDEESQDNETGLEKSKKNSQSEKPATAKQKRDPVRILQEARADVRDRLALAYVRRAELLSAFGDSNEAKQDLETVKKLGVSAQQLGLASFDIFSASEEISSVAAWLDTRGYLLVLLERPDEGLKDLDLAIRLQESILSWFRYALQIRAEQSPDVRQVERALDESLRTLATLLYHRMLALEQLKENNSAEQDRRRLSELGFQPGPHLF